MKKISQKLVNDEQLIKDYLHSNYTVTTSEYSGGWLVLDKITGVTLSKTNFLIMMNKMFFEMKYNYITKDWYDNHIKIMEDKINNHLKKYKLCTGDKILVWVINNGNGKEFDEEKVIKELMSLLPNHINEKKIIQLFNIWFDEEKYRATKELIGC